MNLIRAGRRLAQHSLAKVCWPVMVLTLAAAPVVRAASSPPSADVQAPFTTEAPARLATDEAWAGILADRALHAGMYHLAEGLYRRALDHLDVDPGWRRPLQLGLVTALIAQTKRDEALAVLEEMPGERDHAWRLRRGIVDFLARDFANVRARLPTIEASELPVGDVGWYHFLRAMRQEEERDRSNADSLFRDAVSTSVSTAATAWFRLAQLQYQLTLEEPTEDVLAQLRRTSEDPHFEGQPLGMEYALMYAAALERLDRKSEAVRVLTRLRDRLPRGQAEWRDRTLLLLGLISGVESDTGLQALEDLLEHGANPDWQRIALQRFMAAGSVPGNRARTALARLLDVLLARTPQHPLTEDLLYYRASLALQDQKFEDAEIDANALRTRFPGSNLRADALALLASSSWQRTRYRSAADYAAQFRDERQDPRERARLAVLVAECYFRAGEEAGAAEDYRNAADAYAQVQEDLAQLATDVGPVEAERITGATLGAVYFQRVLALIRSGNMELAAELLSGPAVAIDPQRRWQAAWNYVRYLQLNRQFDEAFRRMEAWGAAENAPPELRLKFLWLLAQLTIEVGRSAETEARLAAVRAFLAGPEGRRVDASTRAEVESNTALLGAKALLAQGDAEAGLRALDQLRRDFPESKAAIFSYIIQAGHLSAAGQLVEAQKLLISLADAHPKSEYAPRALFEAAEQAQKRGQDPQFIEARELLDRLATEYPQDRYEFFARLEQGDILRKLNQFAAAEQVYLLLENRYPNHPERHIAQLSLADTQMAQAENDPLKFEAAISRLERLTDTAADADLRVEAGFKLGYGWQSHGDLDRAADVYWDVYLRFLGEPRPGQEQRPKLESNGRYWLARALLELGEVHHKAGRRENARRSFQLILDHNLPGDALANGWLAQLRAGG